MDHGGHPRVSTLALLHQYKEKGLVESFKDWDFITAGHFLGSPLAHFKLNASAAAVLLPSLLEGPLNSALKIGDRTPRAHFQQNPSSPAVRIFPYRLAQLVEKFVHLAWVYLLQSKHQVLQAAPLRVLLF